MLTTKTSLLKRQNMILFNSKRIMRSLLSEESPSHKIHKHEYKCSMDYICLLEPSAGGCGSSRNYHCGCICMVTFICSLLFINGGVIQSSRVKNVFEVLSS